MGKSNLIKIGGFIGTVAAGAALVGSAVTGTGAYFTDSHDGSLTATSGHLRLNTTDTNLRFDNLMPGEDVTKSIDFNVDSNGKSDVWLVFDKADINYAKWTGPKNDPLYPDGGMGRYGHVAIGNGAGVLFQSWNLQNLPAGSTDPVCDVNADGHGAGRPATSRDDTPPLCGVPTAIKIASNLSSGQGGVLKITFGLTGRARGQESPVAAVPFKVVATQAGIRPGQSDF